MNEAHLAFCGSDEWREVLTDQVLPWCLGELDLGPDVIEVGPGPGLVTDLLRARVEHLTAVEIDDDLAARLAERLAGTNVDVLHADATNLPLDPGRFSAAVSFTMLHHVPSAELQDRLFSEMVRVVATDGVVLLSDSVASDDLRAFHGGDTYNPVDPTTVADRLTSAGLGSVEVRVNSFGWVAHGHKP
ncbi:MAG: class I SAM-dependent methyltransferase [Acidimicrobiales bacterium]